MISRLISHALTKQQTQVSSVSLKEYEVCVCGVNDWVFPPKQVLDGIFSFLQLYNHNHLLHLKEDYMSVSVIPLCLLLKPYTHINKYIVAIQCMNKEI